MKAMVTEESPNGKVTSYSVSFDDKDIMHNKENEENESESGSCVRPGPIVSCGLKALLCLAGSIWCAKRRCE